MRKVLSVLLAIPLISFSIACADQQGKGTPDKADTSVTTADADRLSFLDGKRIGVLTGTNFDSSVQ